MGCRYLPHHLPIISIISIVHYLAFPSSIYIRYKYYTTCVLMLSHFLFITFSCISFVHGSLFNFIPLFCQLMTNYLNCMPIPFYYSHTQLSYFIMAKQTCQGHGKRDLSSVIAKGGLS